jgi:hypothetical protein
MLEQHLRMNQSPTRLDKHSIPSSPPNITEAEQHDITLLHVSCEQVSVSGSLAGPSQTYLQSTLGGATALASLTTLLLKAV